MDVPSDRTVNGGRPAGAAFAEAPGADAPNGRAASAPVSRLAADRPVVDGGGDAEPTPRSSHEDVMLRARELRAREDGVGRGDGERGG